MTIPTMEAISNLARDTASRYSTDTIVILGKGPSADDVDSRVFTDSVVIGVNDAERIHPTDVTIFHEDWVVDSLIDSGLHSEAYVTSVDFTVPGKTVVHLPFEPLSNDAEDLVMLRFQNREDIAIEEAMFLTALELARTIADHRGRTQTVYMVGFDFTPETGTSKKATTEFRPDLSSTRSAGIQMQEYILRNALYALQDSNLDVQQVGPRDFSALTVEQLNQLHRVEIFGGPVERETGFEGPTEIPPVEVTAEITTNHFGDLGRLEKLVRAAHAAGADWVKVQKRDIDTFYTPEQLAQPYKSPFGSTFGDYRRQLELDANGFAFLDELTKELGIKWFASVLDKPSFKFMMELGSSLIKLPSTISEKREYLEYVAQNYTGSLVISTGMTDKAYEDWLLSTFTKQDTLYLLHCNSAYPTPDEHTNIGVVRHYASLAAQHASKGGPRIVPGYSSHDYGWMASALAVAAGAGMLEKHVKLGNTEWAHFDAVAVDLETSAFGEYVQAIRKAQLHVGSTTKRITASEHHKY